VADPGALLVEEAHRLNITVVPWPVLQSLLIALMASGLKWPAIFIQWIFGRVKPHERGQGSGSLKRSETEINPRSLLKHLTGIISFLRLYCLI